MNNGLLPLSFAALAISVVAACSTMAPSTSTEPSEFSTVNAKAATSTLPAAVPSPEPVGFAMTMPNASCRVYPSGQAAATGVIVADSRGIARFQAVPASWGSQLTLDCTNPHDGTTGHYSVDLGEAATFAPPPPLPSTTRPALSGDPANYTQDQLIAAGFPPRPSTNDATYNDWLKVVSSPTTIVDPAPVARFDRTAGGTLWYTNSWAGIVLQQAGVRYELANATMIAPSLCGNGGLCVGAASEWAGLGGWGSDRALIQDGFYMTNNLLFGAEYEPFIEYWPSQQNEEAVNLSLSQGQSLFASCWESNSQGARIVGGGWGAFYLHNTTTGQAIPIMVVQDTGQAFAGPTADFIIEQQSNFLVDYDFTSMTGGGYDINQTLHDYIKDNYLEVWTRDSSNNLVQIADPSGAETTNFYWQALQ